MEVSATLAGQLKALGVAPADVTYVAFSHFHSDHMGNANLFAASTWILNQAELSWALSPAPVAVDASLFSAYKSAKTQMIDGDHDVFGDGAKALPKFPAYLE
jgi:glyoxylase-like metal-dependent hydrolase (beta-lactamase superfamily II)